MREFWKDIKIVWSYVGFWDRLVMVVIGTFMVVGSALFLYFAGKDLLS